MIDLVKDPGRILSEAGTRRQTELLLRKKATLLDKLRTGLKKDFRSGVFHYPDVIKLAGGLSISYDVLGNWLRTDQLLRAKMADIEAIGLQECRRIVFTAAKKLPMIAMRLLEARAPEFQPVVKHEGTIAHFHIISSVRSPGIVADAEVISVTSDREHTSTTSMPDKCDEDHTVTKDTKPVALTPQLVREKILPGAWESLRDVGGTNVGGHEKE